MRKDEVMDCCKDREFLRSLLEISMHNNTKDARIMYLEERIEKFNEVEEIKYLNEKVNWQENAIGQIVKEKDARIKELEVSLDGARCDLKFQRWEKDRTSARADLLEIENNKLKKEIVELRSLRSKGETND